MKKCVRDLLLAIIVVTVLPATMLVYGQTVKPRRIKAQPTPAEIVPPAGDGGGYVGRPWEPVSAVPDLRTPFLLSPSLSTNTWTSIGPAPLNAGGSNGNVSGRIAGIAAHPTDANTIYVAAAGGGVWKTINGGTSWSPLTDSQLTTSMGCIGISRTNPNHVYAGTGEANNSLDSNFGRGILVSTNAGGSWALATGPAGVFSTNRMTCSEIAVDPTNENIAYAAMADIGHNGVFTFNITGIYKTTDGGTTWANVTQANGKESTFPWSDVAVDPNVPSIVYGAVGYVNGTANNAIYKSTDSGATWTQLNAANAPVGASFGRLGLAISRTNFANVLYVGAEDNSVTSGLARFVRSDDAGATFNVFASTPNYMGSQGWYDQDLAVDPSISSTMYAFGATNATLGSVTSGASWSGLSAGAVTPHVDHHAIAFDANGKLLDGDDGGIYRLEDPNGPTWTNLNGNLATIQFQGIGLHPTNAQIAVGGSQDNGTQIYGGSPIWTETDGGDGGVAKFSQTNGNIVYHQIPVASFGSNFFRVSTNAGASWVTRTTGITADQSFQQFYSPIAVDPGNGDRVLYGTRNVWETTNEGTTWTALSTVGVNGWNPSGKNTNAIGLAPSTVNTIYAAVHAGNAGNTDMFVTTDHGATWTQHNLAVAGQVQDIQVDPTTPTTAYAVLSTFSASGNVFKTVDGGTNWVNISGDLAAATSCGCALPVWSLQLDTAHSKIYVGVEDGVYVTSNGGAHWTRFGGGLPNGQVFQIEFNKNLSILGAAIHGRGMWEILTNITTAAEVSISGRVLTSGGAGLRGASVMMTDANGKTRTAISNAFGYYSFNEVPSGQSYTLVASSRRFAFAPRVMTVVDELADVDFTALY
ncbi:MAG: carboxypeptidase regulatory-like domain-containing protein [Pyrinomonadaceae bacterium]